MYNATKEVYKLISPTVSENVSAFSFIKRTATTQLTRCVFIRTLESSVDNV